MSSQSRSSSNPRASRHQEDIDSYPNIPEPKQSHGGSTLAILSIIAILGFGAWAALGTFSGTREGLLPLAQPAATVAPTKAPAAAGPTQSPTPAISPTKGAGATAVPSPGRSGTPGPGGTRVHVVGSGDTLYRIAQIYGTTVEAIMAANGFADRSQILHVGDKLNIP